MLSVAESANFIRASPSKQNAVFRDAESVTDHENNILPLCVTRRVVFHAQGNNLLGFNRLTHELIKLFDGHTGFITSVRYFNFTVYTGSQDSTVIAWNLRSGEPLRVYRGHTAPVSSIEIERRSPQANRSLFSASWDGTVRCWSTGQTPRLKQTYRIGDKPVESFLVHDGFLFAGSGADLRVVDLHSGDTLQVLQAPEEQLHHSIGYDIATHKLIACGSAIVMHDLRAKSSQVVKAKALSKVNHVCVGGDVFWTGHADGSINCWSTDMGELMYATEDGHTGAVSRFLLIDSKYIVSASVDKTCIVWDQRSGRKLHVLNGHNDTVTALSIYKGILYSSSDDGDVRIWACDDEFVYMGLYKGSSATITGMAFFGNLLIYCNTIGHIIAWDIEEARLIVECNISLVACTALCVVNDDVFVAAGSMVRKYNVMELVSQEAEEKDDDLYLGQPLSESVVEFKDDITDIGYDDKYLYCATATVIYRCLRRNLSEYTTFDAMPDPTHPRMSAVNLPALAAGLIPDLPDPTTKICVVNQHVYSISSHSLDILQWSHQGKLLSATPMPQAGTAICADLLEERIYVGSGEVRAPGSANHLFEYSVANPSEGPQLLSEHNHHLNEITSITVSETDIFVGSMDETVSVWRKRDMKLWHVVREHIDAVTSLVAVNGVLHSASNRIFSTEIAMFSTYGVLISYRVAAGYGGLFGRPVEPLQILEEQKLIRRQRAKFANLDQGWQFGLCAPLSCEGFLCSALMPCVAEGFMVTRREETTKPGSGGWLVFFKSCLACLFCWPCARPFQREKSRLAYKIQGDLAEDLATSLLCPCCSISQELSEVQYHASANYSRQEALGKRVNSMNKIAQSTRFRNRISSQVDVDVSAPPLDVRECDDSVAKTSIRNASFLNLFVLGYLMFLVDSLQLLSFAFTIGQGVTLSDQILLNFTFATDSQFPNQKGVVDFFRAIQSFTPTIASYDLCLAVAVLLMLFLWTLFVMQDGLEWRRFLYPSNRFVARSRRFARTATKFLTHTCFMPLFQTFVLAFSCTNKTFDIIVDGQKMSHDAYAWDANSNVECYKDVHLLRCVLIFLGALFYVIPVLRMTRVGFELSKIELTSNPLDWSGDNILHSFKHPCATANYYVDMTALLVKAGMVVLAVTVSSHESSLAMAFTILMAVLVVVTVIFPPYFSRSMNAARLGTYSAILAYYGFVFYLEVHERRLSSFAFWLSCIGFFVMTLLGGYVGFKLPRARAPNLNADNKSVIQGRMTVMAFASHLNASAMQRDATGSINFDDAVRQDSALNSNGSGVVVRSSTNEEDMVELVAQKLNI